MMRQRGVPCGFRFFFQAIDNIRDLVRSRWLGGVYKSQRGRDDEQIERDKQQALDLSLIHI